MVFILAASSLDHALETLTPEKREQYKEKNFSIPGLSFNPNSKNPRKIVQNLLSKDLEEKNNIGIWHDVLNKSISRHESTNFQALTVPEVIDVLKGLQNKRSALVYCQRHRTPNIFEDLNVLKTDHNIEVFSIVEDFISSKKQKDPELLKKYYALHQSPELELKSLDFILRKGKQLSAITERAVQRSLASVPATLQKGLPRTPPSEHRPPPP